MLALTLLFALILVDDDVEVPLPPLPGPRGQSYAEAEVHAGLWRVHIRFNGRPRSTGSIGTMFYTADLARRAGKAFYRTEYLGGVPAQTEGPDRIDLIALDVHMWDEPPEGYHVLSFDDAASQEAAVGIDESLIVFRVSSLFDAPGGDEDLQARSHTSRTALLAERSVKVDALDLQRERFDTAELGAVRSLGREAAGELWPAPVFAADRDVVSWLDEEGGLVKQVRLWSKRAYVLPFTPRDGEVAFLDEGGGWQAVGVLDAGGRLLWEHDEIDGSAPNQLVAGDRDRDGVADFVVATNGFGGVFLLDENGVIERRVDPGDVFDVALIDGNRDGTPEIFFHGREEFLVFDAEGDPVELAQTLPRHGSGFDILADRDGTLRIAQLEQELLMLSSADGLEVERYEMPGAPPAGKLHLARVRWFPDERPHLAVSCTGAVRDQLYVFDAEGELVHHELIGGDGLPLAVLPDRDGVERLLVGTLDGIWAYSRPRE